MWNINECKIQNRETYQGLISISFSKNYNRIKLIFSLAILNLNKCPIHVIMWVCVTDIPDGPQRRHNTLGDAFCREVLNQDFNKQLQASGYDHVYIPVDFDSNLSLKRWFIFDLNVKEELNEKDVLQILHLVYLARHKAVMV